MKQATRFYYVVLFMFAMFLASLSMMNSFLFECTYKGAGHILRADLAVGIFYIASSQLFVSTVIAGLTFVYLSYDKRVVMLRYAIAIIMVPVSLYLLFKITDVVTNEYYDQLYRIGDLAGTWVLRVLGIIIGFQLTRKITNEAPTD